MSTQRDLDRLVQEMKGRTPLRASALLITIFAVIGAVFIWAWATEIDDVTRAPGRVVPAGDLQRVQAAEAGVIRAVFVEEGAIVEAGAPVVELDGLVQTSRLGREGQRAIALLARIERLSAEIDGRAPVFPAELEAAAPELVVSERALHVGRAAALTSEIGGLERRQEQVEARTEIRTATRTRDILAEERAIVAPLVERGVEPQTTLLTLRRQEEEIGGRIAGAEAALARLETALAEVEDTIAATRSQFAAEALRELADATGELAALRPSLPALESMAARAVLRAPVAGIVKRLHRRTIG